MANIFEIPLLSSLKPIWQSDKFNAHPSGTVLLQGFNPSFNYRDIDSDWYYRTLKEYEQKQAYVQPFQQSDTIRVQWLGVLSGVGQEATDLGAYQHARLLDSNGSEYAVKAVTVVQDATLYYGSKKLYTITIKLYDVPEGKYFLQVYHHPASNLKTMVVFEPFHVKQVHIKTVRFDWYNTFNDQSVIYPATTYIPQIRVHGCITDVTNESKFNVYEDQPLNVEMVSGIPYRVYELTLGGNKGIPQWYADVIERVLLTDVVKIDGKEYTREQGAKLESKKEAGKPLNTYTIKLRERINTATIDIAEAQVTIVGTMPQTKYFWIEAMTFETAATNVRLMFQGKRNFLDYLNSTWMLNKGHWAEDINNNLIFVLNSDTTSITTTTLTTANTLSYGLKFTARGTGDLKLVIDHATTTNKYVLCYSDGTASSSIATLDFPDTHISKTFSTNTTKDMFVIMSNIQSIADETSTVEITAIDGDIPSDCTAFSMALLFPKISFVGNLFRYMTSIVTVDLSSQKIPTANIDEIIMNLYDVRTKLHASCAIYLSNQTPSAPPSNTQGINLFKTTIQSIVTTLDTD